MDRVIIKSSKVIRNILEKKNSENCSKNAFYGEKIKENVNKKCIFKFVV